MTQTSAAAEAAVVEGLTALLRRQSPAARSIRFNGLSRAAGGLSRENWSFDVSWIDERGQHLHQLMLMRDAAGTLLNTDRTREFAVLKALEGSAVAAPVVHWLDVDGRFLGAPSIVMDRVSGTCDYMVLNGNRPMAERVRLAGDFLELLAGIQAVDWQGADLGGSLGIPRDKPSRTQIGHWEAEYHQARREPLPEMDYILNWMKKTAPDAQDVVLVHGDFKPGNALVEGDRITAKLDWETAHLGDPLEDLGWITNPVRKREHQISGHWERAGIVAAYRELTGRKVPEPDLIWWNIFSCWKLAVIQLTAVNEFVAGRYNRVFQTPTWLFRPMLQMMDGVP